MVLKSFSLSSGLSCRRCSVWQVDCFGCRLHEYGNEMKGATLVNRKRVRFAKQQAPFPDSDRQKLCRSFLAKGHAGDARQSRDEFTAYGQACLRMARETFALLHQHEAVLLASAIPRGVAKPPDYRFDDYLRKDMVFLFERFFSFLEQEKEPGILVMDETEKREDRRFVARLEAYFTKTDVGRHRTAWIVPTPFFVSSDMTYAVQAADLCIYCINWGFRLPGRGMNANHRADIAEMFGSELGRLQFRGQGYRDGRVFRRYGIFYVPDPYRSASGA